MSKGIKWAIIGVVVLLVVGTGALMLYTDPGAGIYPNVTVSGIEVGGMSRAEAEAALEAGLPDPAEAGLSFQADGRSWRYSRAALGAGWDYGASAGAAHAVGREGSGLQQRLEMWRLRREGVALEPVALPADAARVETAVARVAAEVDRPPQDAALDLSGSVVTVSPAQTGRRVDQGASVVRVLASLEQGEAEVALAVEELPPLLAEPEPARSQAEALLARPFVLDTDDPLTAHQGQVEVSPAQLAGWMRPEAQGERMILRFDGAAIRAWVEAGAEEVDTPERQLDVEETWRRVLAALVAGESEVAARIHHPEKPYYVRPGDFFFDIAYNHGFPQWRLEEANPDVDPEALLIGQELVIPSLDVLFPEPLVPGKRIEINLPEQMLRAYEREELVYELRVSSGMSRTPTIQGQFQVLRKFPEAYAQRWSLDMPYFMAIYEERPGFYNGIHELPINSWGYRLSSGVLGWPASFGCIILDVGDSEALYNWAPVGTLVRITGVAPGTPSWTETLDRIVDNPP